jgi:agmatine deiminase
MTLFRLSFPGRVEKVEDDVVKIINAIHLYEQVELFVLDPSMKEKAENKLVKAGVDLNKVTFRFAEYMDAWMRDCGPIFVKDSTGNPALIKWIFNMWGGKFLDLLPDDKLPYKIKEWLNLKMEQPEMVLEGGAIDVNGQGICLTTEQCVLNENRNAGLTKKDIEGNFEKYLGIKKTIWLFEGLVNDHTDGHIDELARFVGPNKIVCAYEDNEKDENYVILKNNYETLQTATNLEGKPFEIIKLPMPHMNFTGTAAGVAGENAKAAVSYTNFYIGNNIILMSVFNDPNDQKAIDIIQNCFPDRKVVPIDCRDIIFGGGGVHCLTLHQPTY